MGAETSVRTGTKKKKTVVKRVVRKRIVSALQNQALMQQSHQTSLTSTPDARHQRMLMSQTVNNLNVSG